MNIHKDTDGSERLIIRVLHHTGGPFLPTLKLSLSSRAVSFQESHFVNHFHFGIVKSDLQDCAWLTLVLIESVRRIKRLPDCKQTKAPGYGEIYEIRPWNGGSKKWGCGHPRNALTLWHVRSLSHIYNTLTWFLWGYRWAVLGLGSRGVCGIKIMKVGDKGRDNWL